MAADQMDMLCQQLDILSVGHDISDDVLANGFRSLKKVIVKYRERVENNKDVSDEDKQAIREQMVRVASLMIKTRDRGSEEFNQVTEVDVEVLTQSFHFASDEMGERFAKAMKGPAALFWMDDWFKVCFAGFEKRMAEMMDPEYPMRLIMETKSKGLVADMDVVPVPRVNQWVIKETENGSQVSRSEIRTQDMINCLIIRPKEIKHKDTILYYIHGGGFCFLSPGLYSEVLSNWSSNLGVVVVAVDYRKAPDHRFPAGLQDCLDAYSFFSSSREEDKQMVRSITKLEQVNKVVVAGDSAGGNLSASLTFALKMIKDAGDPDVKLPSGIHLIYPYSTPAPIAYPSNLIQNLDPIINTSAMSMFMSLYPKTDPLLDVSKDWLTNKPDSRILKLLDKQTADPLFNNMAWSDWRSLEDIPLQMFVCEFDALMDMGLQVAKRWQGRKRVRVGRDLVHGMLSFASDCTVLMSELESDLDELLCQRL